MSAVLNIAMIVHNDAKLALKSITEITKVTQRGKYAISVVGYFQDETSLQLIKTLKKDGLVDNLSILNKPVCAAAMANIAWRMTDSPLYLWLPAGMYPKKFHWIDTILSYWRGGLPVSTLCGVESASPDNWPPSEKNKIFKILQKGEAGQAAFIPRSVVKVANSHSKCKAIS